MSDVTMVGLGVMGSALAAALQRAGHSLTVWNRTSAKAEPLVRDGATLAPDLSTAVAASPVTLVCVEDYSVTYSILSAPEVRSRLSGRVLVQLSSGTPQEAREMERWAHDSGAEYLDGSIEAYPEQIGTQEAAIFVGGAETTFQRCEPLLRPLAGSLVHLGEQVGRPNAQGLAFGAAVYGTLLGTLHAACICEAEGLPIDAFTATLAEAMPLMGGAVKDLGERIQEQRYDESQATLRTYAIGVEHLVQHARDSQISRDFPAYASNILRKGMSNGLGGQDLAALIEVLRGDA